MSLSIRLVKYTFIFWVFAVSYFFSPHVTLCFANEIKSEQYGHMLTNDDCIRCHQGIVNAIESDGLAHRDKVTCLDCHNGHPPGDWDVIPECTKCHIGNPHFEKGVCLKCHSNPHTPLILTMTRDITEPCLTCHGEQGKQLRENPSIHSSLACTACHYQHGQIPDCLRCHKPHSETVVPVDCNRCHQAHMPLAIYYDPDIPSESCGACHEGVFKLLQKGVIKHKEVACVTCHQEKHKTIPECELCHGPRHSDWILTQVLGCGDCHGIAHDLDPVSKDHERRIKLLPDEGKESEPLL